MIDKIVGAEVVRKQRHTRYRHKNKKRDKNDVLGVLCGNGLRCLLYW